MTASLGLSLLGPRPAAHAQPAQLQPAEPAQLQPAEPAQLQPAEPAQLPPVAAQRLVVLVAHPHDAALAERVRGQLSDLPVALVILDDGATPREADELQARAQTADRALRSHDADAVLWTARRPERSLLLLSRRGHPPLLIARLPVDAHGALSSSDQELGALVVRSAMQALAAGATPSELVAARDERPVPPAPEPRAIPPRPEQAPEPRAVPPRPEQAPPPPPAAPPAAAAREPLRAYATLALQQWIDGSGSLGRSGGTLGLGVDVGDLRLGAEGSMSVPVDVDAPLGTIRVGRHDLLAMGALRLPLGPLDFRMGAHAGVALFSRTTQSDDPRLRSDGGSTTPAFIVGPQLAVARLWGDLGLRVSAALDFMPGPPRFEYAGGDAPSTPAYAPPRIAGRVSVGLEARLP